MIPSYINATHVTEEYEQRLQEAARNSRARSDPGEPVTRQRIGRLIIGLGERVQRQRQSAIDEPAEARLAMN